jgi:hypothetical protein
MGRWGKAVRVAIAGGLAACLLGVSVAGAGETVLDDGQGDVVDDHTAQPIEEPRADLVKSSLTYQGGQIFLRAKVVQPTDPRTDRSWSGESTSVEWRIDTTGDGKADYYVDMYAEAGKITGDVLPAPPPGQEEAEADSLCPVRQPSFSPEEGYSVIVDASCVGNPDGVGYQANFFYDQEAGNENAIVATDWSPNKGLTQPVPKS